MNQPDYLTRPRPHTAGRRAGWAALVVMAVVAALLALAVRGNDPQGDGRPRDRYDTEREQAEDGRDADRISSGLPTDGSDADEAVDTGPPTTTTRQPSDTPVADSGFIDPRNPPTQGRGGADTGRGGGSGPVSVGLGTGGANAAPTTTTPTVVRPRPKPVTVVTTPVTSPTTAPRPTVASTTTEPELVAPPTPPPLARDERLCPRLGLQAIGGDDPSHPLRPTFRALLPDLQEGENIVCGRPLEPWRDLTTQQVVAGGIPVGTLITATDGSSIAMRLADNEWAGYRYRYGGAPTGFNFLGYPVARTNVGGVEVIRTTTGGLVMPAPGTIGVPLVNASYDFWMLHGGPSGEMGVPLSSPAGILGYGAYQDFTNGRMTLPGVTTDIEAFAAPVSRYEWHPRSEFPVDPTDLRHHIVEVTGMSYYIDDDGVAHWIASQSDWMCARWDLGALPIVVPGYILGSFPIGAVFDCPTR